MDLFDVLAALVALAAVLGYLNHRWLRLPSTIGILAIAMAGSLVVLAVGRIAPSLHLHSELGRFLGRINFTSAVMRGMLCFLLFAGALHVELEQLKRAGWTVAALATGGVVISTLLVGLLARVLFQTLGLQIPLPVCFVFGALISPTDPISVLGLLKQLHAPADLEAKFAGESLFNDGVGVVMFFACASFAGLSHEGAGAVGGWGLALFFVRQVGGGLLLGLAFGGAAYRALKSIDYGPLELLITLALVMFMYSVAFRIEVSGPIAVVVAGILIGNHGRRYAMSEATRRVVEAFWGMTDEILNAILFLLLGLVAVEIPWPPAAVIASAAAIPIVLLARLASVGIPIGLLRGSEPGQRGLVALLTWGGLRGGLSVAMVLSLPPFPAKNLLLSATYVVVIFSVVVQGMSMRRLCRHYGLRG